jgi:hypothetical protein
VAATGTATRTASPATRSPRQLFAEYLTARGADDPAVAALFDEIYDECVTPAAAAAPAAGSPATSRAKR